jgi:ribosomal protein L29
MERLLPYNGSTIQLAKRLEKLEKELANLRGRTIGIKCPMARRKRDYR